MTTYTEYLEAVRKQEARDRDRFMGHDSHEDEPVYSAETGGVISSGAAGAMSEWIERQLADLRTVISEEFRRQVGEWEKSLIDGDGAGGPVGILEAE